MEKKERKKEKGTHVCLPTTSSLGNQGHSCPVHWQVGRRFALYMRFKLKIKLDWIFNTKISQLLKLDLFLQLKCLATDSFQGWGVSGMFQGASLEEKKKRKKKNHFLSVSSWTGFTY